MSVVEVCAVVDRCLLGWSAAKDFGFPSISSGGQIISKTKLSGKLNRAYRWLSK